MTLSTHIQYIRPGITLGLILCSLIAYGQPADFAMECAGNPGNVAPIFGTVKINGVNAVPNEDFIALFDSDGFVVGTGSVTENTGFCGAGVTVALINFNVFGVPPNDDVPCPDGFGANDEEVMTGLVYDGSTNTYYDLPGDLTYDEEALNLQPGGSICAELNAINVVLPAALTSFHGRALAPKHVALHWQTAQEDNVSHYEVQRSRNGREWSVIGEVAAVGESTTALDYDFDDLDPIGERQFYRLRMVDNDGSDELSGIVIVDIEQTGDRTVSVFPNPASTTTRLGIQLGGEWREDRAIHGQLIDVSGRTLAHYSGLGVGTTSVALPDGIAEGLYILRITQADRVFTTKVSLR